MFALRKGERRGSWEIFYLNEVLFVFLFLDKLLLVWTYTSLLIEINISVISIWFTLFWFWIEILIFQTNFSIEAFFYGSVVLYRSLSEKNKRLLLMIQDRFYFKYMYILIGERWKTLNDTCVKNELYIRSI